MIRYYFFPLHVKEISKQKWEKNIKRERGVMHTSPILSAHAKELGLVIVERSLDLPFVVEWRIDYTIHIERTPTL